MREKIAGVFFSVLSWSVWAASICAILFGLGILIFGAERPPQFTLSDVTLTALEKNDPVLEENQKTGENWYKLEMNLRVSADRFSPFTYTAGAFALKAPGEIKHGCEYFLTLDAPLEYDKLSPDDFLLTLYLRYPAGEAALREHLGEIGFGMREMYTRFAFFKREIRSNMPGFTLSDLM